MPKTNTVEANRNCASRESGADVNAGSATGQMEPTPRSMHTPGPWEVNWNPNCAPSGAQTIGAPKYTWSVATASPCDERDANARLIAAAPELLEALRELIDAIWDGRLEEMGAEHFTDPARAIIAKAEGSDYPNYGGEPVMVRALRPTS